MLHARRAAGLPTRRPVLLSCLRSLGNHNGMQDVAAVRAHFRAAAGGRRLHGFVSGLGVTMEKDSVEVWPPPQRSVWAVAALRCALIAPCQDHTAPWQHQPAATQAALPPAASPGQCRCARARLVAPLRCLRRKLLHVHAVEGANASTVLAVCALWPSCVVSPVTVLHGCDGRRRRTFSGGVRCGRRGWPRCCQRHPVPAERWLVLLARRCTGQALSRLKKWEGNSDAGAQAEAGCRAFVGVRGGTRGQHQHRRARRKGGGWL